MSRKAAKLLFRGYLDTERVLLGVHRRCRQRPTLHPISDLMPLGF
jgi:hypothetical protein